MPQASQDPETPELYEGPNWRLIQAIVGAVIVACVIGFLVWLIFFSQTASAPAAPANATTSQRNQSGGTGSTFGNNSNSANGTNSGSNSGQNLPSGSSAGSGAATSSNSSDTLTNTGPGDTLAIFLGVAAVASLGYHLKFKQKRS